MTSQFLLPSLTLFALAGSLFAQDPALTFHAPPKPLPDGAVTEDWPRFLGAHDNATSKENKLLGQWPEGGPRKVWELLTGEGYSSPVFADGKLVYFHRLPDPDATERDAGRETIDCLEPETGKRLWRVDYPVSYRDRYGFSPGPRSSPVLHDGKVYTTGVTGMFHCLDLQSGRILWKRDLRKEFAIPQYFFGFGPSPAAWKDRIIVNVGGKAADPEQGVCVAAFDATTGRTLWEVKDSWGASYASPTVATLRGKTCAIVVAGGESRPPHGGLLVIDVQSGEVHDRVPWRADIYESVLASSPLVIGDRRIFFSDCYAKGGLMLEFDENLKSREVWKERWFGMHWMVPLLIDGHLYGFAGRNIPDTQFKCANAETGEILWENDMQWREGRWTAGLFRATLLQADGRVFCLGEDGVLAELKLSPKGPEFVQRTRLFTARSTWALPCLHKGLLYVSQNEHDLRTNAPPRLICYDFRGE